MKFSGHPMLDGGVATITAFSNKDSPFQVDDTDLYKIAQFMAQEYPKSPLKSFLSIAFTSNGWFIQDAYNPDNKPVEKRDGILQTRNKWATHHLLQWGQDIERHSIERDVFTGEPALAVELSGKLPPGRAGRAQVPMLSGDDTINFYANGLPGVPISGETMLCLQALPLGCAKCGGKLLLVHSDNPEIMLHFAHEFLTVNRRDIQLAQTAGSKEMPGREYSQRTLLITTLLNAKLLQSDAKAEEEHFSITAYHFSNSGQGPGLEIYHLPSQSIDFLQEVNRAETRLVWNKIVNRAWEIQVIKEGIKKGKSKKTENEKVQVRRNFLYEDILSLPLNAKHFIRMYFLRQAVKFARGENDPRSTYAIKDEIDLVSWQVISIFLKRILNMDRQQIEQIRTLGDRFAQHVKEQNDRYFFTNFREQKYQVFRTLILRAALAQLKRGQGSLIDFDSYVDIFEVAENDARVDWRLARDLVFLRMIEQLHKLEWLTKNTDALPDLSEDSDDDK